MTRTQPCCVSGAGRAVQLRAQEGPAPAPRPVHGCFLPGIADHTALRRSVALDVSGLSRAVLLPPGRGVLAGLPSRAGLCLTAWPAEGAFLSQLSLLFVFDVCGGAGPAVADIADVPPARTGRFGCGWLHTCCVCLSFRHGWPPEGAGRLTPNQVPPGTTWSEFSEALTSGHLAHLFWHSLWPVHPSWPQTSRDPGGLKPPGVRILRGKQHHLAVETSALNRPLPFLFHLGTLGGARAFGPQSFPAQRGYGLCGGETSPQPHVLLLSSAESSFKHQKLPEPSSIPRYVHCALGKSEDLTRATYVGKFQSPQEPWFLT